MLGERKTHVSSMNSAHPSIKGMQEELRRGPSVRPNNSGSNANANLNLNLLGAGNTTNAKLGGPGMMTNNNMNKLNQNETLNQINQGQNLNQINQGQTLNQG